MLNVLLSKRLQMTRSNSKNYVIPKIIHYCRFGGNKKPEKLQWYIDSWKKYCPDYKIVERNETNFDAHTSPYAEKMYNNKKRAFLSDYARFWILYNEWGIYLDTDVEIMKSLDVFLHHNCFLWFQDLLEVNGAIIGTVPQHWFIKDVLETYKNKSHPIVLPRLITPMLRKKWLQYNKYNLIKDIAIYPKQYFYPFAYFESFLPSCVTEKTYTIHRFEWTWLPKIVVKIWFPVVKLFYRLLSFIL